MSGSFLFIRKKHKRLNEKYFWFLLTKYCTPTWLHLFSNNQRMVWKRILWLPCYQKEYSNINEILRDCVKTGSSNFLAFSIWHVPWRTLYIYLKSLGQVSFLSQIWHFGCISILRIVQQIVQIIIMNKLCALNMTYIGCKWQKIKLNVLPVKLLPKTFYRSMRTFWPCLSFPLWGREARIEYLNLYYICCICDSSDSIWYSNSKDHNQSCAKQWLQRVQ